MINSQTKKQYEFIDFYRDGDIVTYLAKDFNELGQNATPYKIIQNPSTRTPFIKMRVVDTDGFRLYSEEQL